MGPPFPTLLQIIKKVPELLIILREEYVSLSNDLRVLNLFTDPTVVLSIGFTSSFVLSRLALRSARILGISTHSLLILVTHLFCLHTSRDRGQWHLHTLQALRLITLNKLPIKFLRICSIDLITDVVAATPFTLSILRFIFSVTVGTQASNSVSFLQRKGYTYWGTPIFVNNIILLYYFD